MKSLIIFLFGVLLFYLFICALVFFFQEKIIFFPQKLPNNHQFQFEGGFEEINIETSDKVTLHGVLFKSDLSKAKGLIFYLHGNAGCVDSWGMVPQDYTQLGYDLFMMDYRGYEKSGGGITSEIQFLDDARLVYDSLKSSYSEDEIIVLGYSLGTCTAAMLAADRNPKMLILQAPYYSLIDMKRRTYPIIPDFFLKYRFETYKYIDNLKVPITIFHGTEDGVVYYGSSIKLNEHLKPTDQLITLKGEGHNDMSSSQEYMIELKRLLR